MTPIAVQYAAPLLATDQHYMRMIRATPTIRISSVITDAEWDQYVNQYKSEPYQCLFLLQSPQQLDSLHAVLRSAQQHTVGDIRKFSSQLLALSAVKSFLLDDVSLSEKAERLHENLPTLPSEADIQAALPTVQLQEALREMRDINDGQCSITFTQYTQGRSPIRCLAASFGTFHSVSHFKYLLFLDHDHLVNSNCFTVLAVEHTSVDSGMHPPGTVFLHSDIVGQTTTGELNADLPIRCSSHFSELTDLHFALLEFNQQIAPVHNLALCPYSTRARVTPLLSRRDLAVGGASTAAWDGHAKMNLATFNDAVSRSVLLRALGREAEPDDTHVVLLQDPSPQARVYGVLHTLKPQQATVLGVVFPNAAVTEDQATSWHGEATARALTNHCCLRLSQQLPDFIDKPVEVALGFSARTDARHSPHQYGTTTRELGICSFNIRRLFERQEAHEKDVPSMFDHIFTVFPRTTIVFLQEVTTPFSNTDATTATNTSR